MRCVVLAGTVLLLARAAVAQPADCPVAPSPVPGGGGTLPLALDIGNMPGVKRGQGGQVYVNVPYGDGGMSCVGPGPPPPADILGGQLLGGQLLGGQPGNVLAGPPSPDLLRGPGRPVVEVTPR